MRLRVYNKMIVTLKFTHNNNGSTNIKTYINCTSNIYTYMYISLYIYSCYIRTSTTHTTIFIEQTNQPSVLPTKIRMIAQEKSSIQQF